MVEDIDDPAEGFHQHIDLIYFCRLVSAPAKLNEGWLWVSRRELASGALLSVAGGAASAPPDDVADARPDGDRPVPELRLLLNRQNPVDRSMPETVSRRARADGGRVGRRAYPPWGWV